MLDSSPMAGRGQIRWRGQGDADLISMTYMTYNYMKTAPKPSKTYATMDRCNMGQ